MSKKVEFWSGNGDHLAYMTLEEVVPEEGEEPFLWPVFTEVSGPESEEWLLDLVGGVLVQNDKGELLTWDDGDEYIDWMVTEFRPPAVTADIVE